MLNEGDRAPTLLVISFFIFIFIFYFPTFYYNKYTYNLLITISYLNTILTINLPTIRFFFFQHQHNATYNTFG